MIINRHELDSLAENDSYRTDRENDESELSIFSSSLPFDIIQVILAVIGSKNKILVELHNNDKDKHHLDILSEDPEKNVFKECFKVDICGFAYPVTEPDEKYGDDTLAKVPSFTDIKQYGTLFYKYGAESLKHLMFILMKMKAEPGSKSLIKMDPSNVVLYSQLSSAIMNAHEDLVNTRETLNGIKDYKRNFLNPNAIARFVRDCEDQLLYSNDLTNVNIGGVRFEEMMLICTLSSIYFMLLGITLRSIDVNLIDENVFFDEKAMKVQAPNFLQMLSGSQLDMDTKQKYFTLLFLYKKIHKFFAFYTKTFLDCPFSLGLLALSSAVESLNIPDDERYKYFNTDIFDYSRIKNMETPTILSFLEVVNPITDFYTFYNSLYETGFNKMRLQNAYLGGCISRRIYDENNEPIKDGLFNFYKMSIEGNDISKLMEESYIKGLYNFLTTTVMGEFPKYIDRNVIRICNVIALIFRSMSSTLANINKLKKMDVYDYVIGGIWYAESYTVFLMHEWFYNDKKYSIPTHMEAEVLENGYDNAILSLRLSITDEIRDYVMSIYTDTYSIDETKSIDDNVIENKMPISIYALDGLMKSRYIFTFKERIDNLPKEEQEKVLDFFKKLSINSSTSAPIINSNKLAEIIGSNRTIFHESKVDVSSNPEVDKLVILLVKVLFNIGFAKDAVFNSMYNVDTLNSTATDKLTAQFIDINTQNIIPRIYRTAKFSIFDPEG